MQSVHVKGRAMEDERDNNASIITPERSRFAHTQWEGLKSNLRKCVHLQRLDFPADFL